MNILIKFALNSKNKYTKKTDVGPIPNFNTKKEIGTINNSHVHSYIWNFLIFPSAWFTTRRHVAKLCHIEIHNVT